MNSRTRSLLIVGIAIALPVSTTLADGPRRSSSARSSGGRSVAQARPTFQSRTTSYRSGAAFQRPGSFSRANNWNGAAFSANRAAFNANRVAINRNATNWNRSGFNRVVTNGNGSNRFAANGINHGGNWNRWNGNWHHNGHHHHDDNFIFFGGFGYPFYSAWDYGYYPSAYYPAYPYSSYYYDPYGYSYGAQTYGGGGYYDDPGYSDPGYGGYQNNDTAHRYSRNGSAHSDQTVAHVQERLAQDGYYKGEIDGVKGSRTYYAIRAYQRDHNLHADGEITDELLQDMGLH